MSSQALLECRARRAVGRSVPATCLRLRLCICAFRVRRAPLPARPPARQPASPPALQPASQPARQPASPPARPPARPPACPPACLPACLMVLLCTAFRTDRQLPRSPYAVMQTHSSGSFRTLGRARYGGKGVCEGYSKRL